ncbi:alpha/beta fold hydrolase [Vibrio ostreicida]|uniref:alpha/beta fold hydrolase n=1 Tax=Vibrio ostreicida TaxID=526588 RepID=UPI0009714BFF|nr:alpha/beta hydrolase [Vibrio ostreicida]
MSKTQTSFQIDGTTLAAMEYGDRQSAQCSLVFLHGWLDNAASFESVMDSLHHQAPYLHLIAIDLPGHGYSPHKAATHFYSFHDYIDDLHQFLVNLSANSVVLVGHSLGALIASCYSAAFPERINGLVQIEGRGPIAEAQNLSVSRLRDGVLSRQAIRRKPKRAFARVADAVELRAKINHIAPELIYPIVERGLVDTGFGWQWRHDVKLQSQSLYRMSFEQAQSIVEHIVCPQLVVLGKHGFPQLQSVDNTESSAVEVVTVEGGHHCHLQAPSRVSNLIFGLVNKI